MHEGAEKSMPKGGEGVALEPQQYLVRAPSHTVSGTSEITEITTWMDEKLEEALDERNLDQPVSYVPEAYTSGSSSNRRKNETPKSKVYDEDSGFTRPQQSLIFSKMQLFRDYLSIDIMNHTEVIKAIMSLGDDDEQLLIPILEALEGHRREEDADRKCYLKVKKCRGPPFRTHYHESHVRSNKNPLFLLEAYAHLRNFDWRGRSFDIYERAYMKPTKPILLVVALFAFFTRAILFAILMIYTWSTYEGNSEAWEHIRGDVWVVCIITSIYFFINANHQVVSSLDFYQGVGFPSWDWETPILPPRLKPENFTDSDIVDVLRAEWRAVWVRRLLYICDMCFNAGLAVAMFAFHLVFAVLIYDDVTDALFNSVVLFFILKLDRVIDATTYMSDIDFQDELAKIVRERFIDMPVPTLQELVVKKDIDVSDPDVSFQNGDKFYVWVDEEDNVHASRRLSQTHFETVTYVVEGTMKEKYLGIIESFASCRKIYDFYRTSERIEGSVQSTASEGGSGYVDHCGVGL